MAADRRAQRAAVRRRLPDAGGARRGGDRRRSSPRSRPAARRALAAGFDLIEIHAAHGYLIHEFLSPIANRRDDQWGGSFDNRTRFLLEIVRAIRAVWPDRLPLAVRLSTTDWLGAEGWDVEDSIALARRLGREGVDLIDCSSGGIAPRVAIDAGPGYQVANAARIRAEAPIATAAVGVITSAAQAEHILRSGQADMVLAGARDACVIPTSPCTRRRSWTPTSPGRRSTCARPPRRDRTRSRGPVPKCNLCLTL